DGHYSGIIRALAIKLIKLLATAVEKLIRTMVLQSINGDVVRLDRVGNDDHRTVDGPKLSWEIVDHPVSDVLDAGTTQQIKCFLRLREARALPATRRLPGALADGLYRILDCLLLVLHAMHGPLHITVPHELPAGLACCAGNARVAFANTTIDGERWDDLMALQNRHEPPKANPHPVLVPGPVRNVWDQRLPHWWRQYGARLRPLDTPLFDIDDHPNRHTRAVRQNELRAVDDSLI